MQYSNIELNTQQSREKVLTQAHIDFFYQFCGFLAELNRLETEAHDRHKASQNQKTANGLPTHQTNDEDKAIWRDFAEQKTALVRQWASASLFQQQLQKGIAQSFGWPARYHYIDLPCRAELIVKSAKKMTVEFYYTGTPAKKNRFGFRLEENGWRLDEVKYGYQTETGWFNVTL
ncbi:Uncharacterised protein [Kingella potus]|uniref:NTF2 fold immunity protein domain-containing protein n=1 Tax=Kingella potus TaxID=265175 RepID=A0A377R371_9NEIS|nr:hypothetical protein [Kingella potus]UOP00657.1 hypothetical protein LVJ84_12765 [Kingella potus]STR02946.1 Uncharacterised protein [Kingella potus]